MQEITVWTNSRGEVIMHTKQIQSRLESLTRKWWFFLLFFLLFFFIPSYSSKPIDPRETSQLVADVLPRALIYSYPAIWPLFKVLPILLILAIILWGDRITRVFSAYVAVTLLAMAILQNMAFTERYGFAIITSNVVVLSIVALFWIWEIVVKENDMTPRKRPWWRYWVIPPALLAFWFPVSIGADGARPDWNPLLILTSAAGLAFCMMVPVYLAVVTLYHPRINRPVVRVTGFVGSVIGLFNMVMWLIVQRETMWWMGVLHVPLLLISIYALIISLPKAPQGSTQTN